MRVLLLFWNVSVNIPPIILRLPTFITNNKSIYYFMTNYHSKMERLHNFSFRHHTQSCSMIIYDKPASLICLY